MSRAWLITVLLLANQFAVAVHAHAPDEVNRLHQCPLCLQLQPGHHAAAGHSEWSLPAVFPERFGAGAFDARPPAGSRLVYHSRAPPVSLR